MSKSILTYVLLSLVFLLSFAPIAGAQDCFCPQPPIPDGVKFAYRCELNCIECDGGRDEAPECKACDRLELVFFNIECCSGTVNCSLSPPPGY